jgi:hypothetical protein
MASKVHAAHRERQGEPDAGMRALSQVPAGGVREAGAPAYEARVTPTMMPSPVCARRPATTIEDLAREVPDREQLGKLSDDELLRKAAREVARAVYVVAHAMMQREDLITTTPGEAGVLLQSLAASAQAVTAGFAQAKQMQAADPRVAEPEAGSTMPPRDPNDDDEENEEEDEGDEDRHDEPPVVREPDDDAVIATPDGAAHPDPLWDRRDRGQGSWFRVRRRRLHDQALPQTNWWRESTPSCAVPRATPSR